jgi:hypothetical protein
MIAQRLRSCLRIQLEIDESYRKGMIYLICRRGIPMSSSPSPLKQYLRPLSIILFLFTEAAVVVQLVKHMR